MKKVRLSISSADRCWWQFLRQWMPQRTALGSKQHIGSVFLVSSFTQRSLNLGMVLAASRASLLSSVDAKPLYGLQDIAISKLV